MTNMNTNQEEQCFCFHEQLVNGEHTYIGCPQYKGINQESWKEKFDKEVGKDSELVKFLTMKYGTHIHAEPMLQHIEDFIEKEIIPQARKEERERILKAVDDLKVASPRCEDEELAHRLKKGWLLEVKEALKQYFEFIN